MSDGECGPVPPSEPSFKRSLGDLRVCAKVGGYIVSRFEDFDGEQKETDFIVTDKAGILRHLDAWLLERDESPSAREEAERSLKKKP